MVQIKSNSSVHHTLTYILIIESMNVKYATSIPGYMGDGQNAIQLRVEYLEADKMITQEHLEHWIKEINWQLNGILNEIAEEKVQMKGINVGKTGEKYVSFEYLLEKAKTIQGTIRCIEDDIMRDEA